MPKEEQKIEYTRVFTPDEIDLLGCDPIEWMNNAIEGKLNKCRKRKVKQVLLENLDEAVKLCERLEKNKKEANSDGQR